MTDTVPIPPGFWEDYTRMLDAHDPWSDQPRPDHGLSTDPAELAAAMNAEEAEHGPGWLQREVNLYDRLVEQFGHTEASRAWGDACEWMDNQAQSTAVEQLHAAIDQARTAAAEGDTLTARAQLLAAAEAAETARELDHYELSDEWHGAIGDLRDLAEGVTAVLAGEAAAEAFDTEVEAVRTRIRDIGCW
jgi:hypothetical protein